MAGFEPQKWFYINQQNTVDLKQLCTEEEKLAVFNDTIIGLKIMQKGLFCSLTNNKGDYKIIWEYILNVDGCLNGYYQKDRKNNNTCGTI